MIDNLADIIANADDNQPRTRVKKPNLQMRYLDEQQRLNLKMSRLNALEEDEDVQKEE